MLRNMHVHDAQSIVVVLPGQSVAMASSLGQSISNIDIYQDRYVVARTSKSLVLVDLTRNVTGEILWGGRGKERFYFGNPEVT